jgi:hypothetical protein
MTGTAHADGGAGGAVALAGPAMAPPQEAAAALMEVAAADDRVSRAHAKAEKAERQAAELADTAAEAVETAEAEAAGVLDRACELLGADPKAVRSTAAAVLAEHARHADEMSRLAAGLGGEG